MVSSKVSFGVMGLWAMMMAMMIMADGVAGQKGPPAPAPASVDCDAVVVQLVDCLPFWVGSESTPTVTCCSNLSAIIIATPQCLCQLYNTTFTEPLGLSVTRALELPPACKLTTPDRKLCASVAPSSVPTPSVPTTAPTTPSSPVTSAPGTETQPNTTASPPPSPNSAPSLNAPSVAAASSLIFALTLIFH